MVNATSVGMGGDGLPLDPDLLSSDQLVADIVYQPLETPLLAAARSLGCTTVGGVGMLLHQAAIQFERWTGAAAPLDAMQAAIDQTLSQR